MKLYMNMGLGWLFRAKDHEGVSCCGSFINVDRWSVEGEREREGERGRCCVMRSAKRIFIFLFFDLLREGANPIYVFICLLHPRF